MDRDFYCFHSNQVTIVMLSAALVNPALFPTFHQREMLDQALAEKTRHSISKSKWSDA